MAKHIWTVLCRRGLLDKATNSVSLIDTLEELEFVPDVQIEEGKQWNSLPIAATLVSFFTRSDYSQPENTRMKIQIVSPDGQIHPDIQPVNINLNENVRLRHFANFENLIFWSSGVHHLVVLLESKEDEWKVVAEIPVALQQKLPDISQALSAST